MLCEYFKRKRSFVSEAKILSFQAQAKTLRNCQEKVSLKQKKQIIQHGGFALGTILAPVASVLGSLLFRCNETCEKNSSRRF